MIKDIDFKNYQSPFSWRYASPQMRQLFSEQNRRLTWRKVWIALARAQYRAGLLTHQEFNDIQKHAKNIDIEKAQEIEKTIYHDLMAEVKTFAKTAKVGGGKIHLGATSTDITDNADVLLISQALQILEEKLVTLIKIFAKKIAKYKDTVCMGYTHLQPAEPTTLGYRFTVYTQDLLNDLRLLRFFKDNLQTKGIKGAVGTSASYTRLLQGKIMNALQLEDQVLQELNLQSALVTTQTYPRKTDLHLTFVLSSIAQSLHKFAFDLRLMQSPNFGEWSEPQESGRVGSSAMPFKRNPDKAEKICSLARYIANLSNLAFANAANSLLERTLDDSASRRIFIPEGFLATDEIVAETNNLVEGLIVESGNIKRNLEKYGLFAATEVLMMEAVKRGANRQDLHEVIRKISMTAWQKINLGQPNPLVNLLKKDKIVSKFIKANEIEKFLDPASHIGLAIARCSLFLNQLDKEIKQ